jgi:hypothetical protein
MLLRRYTNLRIIDVLRLSLLATDGTLLDSFCSALLTQKQVIYLQFIILFVVFITLLQKFFDFHFLHNISDKIAVFMT